MDQTCNRQRVQCRRLIKMISVLVQSFYDITNVFEVDTRRNKTNSMLQRGVYIVFLIDDGTTASVAIKLPGFSKRADKDDT